MSYIGVQPKAGQYRKLDDISGGFNGSTATFNLTVSGQAVTAATAQQLMISLGGVIQNPGVDYTVSTNTITFTTNPASGLDFFGVLLGDAINTGTPSDGTVTTAKLASDLSVDLASGSAGTPSLTFDANSGLFSPANDEISISTNGGERFRVGSAGQLGIGGATYGTSGQVLTSQGSGSAPQWADAAGASIATSSAVSINGSTDVEFTGIGSTVRRIIFAIYALSSNANDRFTLELGHSGGYTTSGYVAWAKTLGGAALATGSQLTSAFDLCANNSSSEEFGGVMELMNVDGNRWVLNSNLQGSADNRKIAGGQVTVGGTLTKLKFDVGSATFDSGFIKIYTFTEA